VIQLRSLLELRECIELSKTAAAHIWEDRGSYLLTNNVEAKTKILDLIILFPNIF